MRLEIELRSILFPLIILEMFLQLDWSPPVVNSIYWTWFGKHTPVYIMSHSWQCMSEQKPSHEVEEIVRRAPRQYCNDAQIWGKVPKQCLQRWMSPRTRPNWAIVGEGPCSGRWPRTSWSLWKSSRVPLWSWENLLEGQPSLQHSINQPFIVEWPDGGDSVKGTWQPTWSLPKGIWRLSDHEKQHSLFWLLNSLAWMPSVTSRGNLAPSLQWSMVVAAACCGDVLQRQGLGD